MGRLQMLKPRVNTIPGRLQMAATMSTQRLRGRAAVERRAEYLRLHPLCVRCTKEGRVGAATVPDHRIPLWAGGADDLEANGDALCHEHHDAKTKCEARMRAVGAWLSSPCTCGQHTEPNQTAQKGAGDALLAPMSEASPPEIEAPASP